MKKIFSIIMLLCVTSTLMAQSKSFIVKDKSGNSQFVKSIIFQKDALDARFSWDTSRNGYKQTNDIENILSITRGEAPSAPTTEAIAVDLGLPSGTKWADRNVGASKPEDYGGYYAWGETEEKDVYDFSTYRFGNQNVNDRFYYDIGSDIIGTQYDVAHVKWGGAWRMPSYKHMKELLNYCSSEGTTINGIKGRKFTGPNGNSIFLPLFGEPSHYWTSTVYASYTDFAFQLVFYFDDSWAKLCDIGNRESGFCVRPVYGYFDPIPQLSLSTNNISLNVGSSKNVQITSGSGNYTVVSDKPNFVTAKLSGTTITINALVVGTATITVKDYDSVQEATITVTVSGDRPSFCPDNNHPHMINLGLPSNLKWSCCNVGASKPEDFGSSFAWGETVIKNVYEWSTYTHCDGSGSSCHDIGSDISGTRYDVAHVVWGSGWVMPSNKEIDELFKYCSIEQDILNGTNGLRFIGSNGGCIFLPDCSYWSSQLQTIVPETAYYWGANTLNKGRVSNSSSRCGGKNIRPVSK